MKNYFKMLSLEKSYGISKIELRKKYLVMQAKLHPDNMVGTNSDIVESSEINIAYTILNDDFARAKHLLELYLVDLDKEVAKIELEDNFLSEMFSIQEEIELENDINKLQNLLSFKLEEREHLLNLLESAFDFLDEEEVKYEKLLIPMRLVIKLKYNLRIIEQIKAKILWLK